MQLECINVNPCGVFKYLCMVAGFARMWFTYIDFPHTNINFYENNMPCETIMYEINICMYLIICLAKTMQDSNSHQSFDNSQYNIMVKYLSSYFITSTCIYTQVYMTIVYLACNMECVESMCVWVIDTCMNAMYEWREYMYFRRSQYSIYSITYLETMHKLPLHAMIKQFLSETKGILRGVGVFNNSPQPGVFLTYTDYG